MQETAPNLTSHERKQLAHYLVLSREERTSILETARHDPQTSGALIYCYRWSMTA